MPNKKKIALISSLITAVIGLVIAFSLLLIWKVFDATSTSQALVYISDAFFISGVMIFGMGCLMLIASTGFFDILAYGLKSVWYLFIKITYKKGEHEKYYDYVERKKELREKRKETSFTVYVVLVGAIFIIIAISLLPFMSK